MSDPRAARALHSRCEVCGDCERCGLQWRVIEDHTREHSLRCDLAQRLLQPSPYDLGDHCCVASARLALYRMELDFERSAYLASQARPLCPRNAPRPTARLLPPAHLRPALDRPIPPPRLAPAPALEAVGRRGNR